MKEDLKEELPKSTARTILTISWWIGTGCGILAFLFGLIIVSGMMLDSYYYYDYYAQGAMMFTSVLMFLVVVGFVAFQVVAYIGLKKVPVSQGWNIFYLVSAILAMNVLKIVGAALALSEYKKGTSPNNVFEKIYPVEESTPKVPAVKDLSKEILELIELKEAGLLTEEEFAIAKAKVLDKL